MIIIIIYIILYLISIFISLFISSKYYSKYFQIINKIGLYLTNLNNITVNNYNLFKETVNQNKKILIVCNHRNYFDGLILTAIFGKISFLILEDGFKNIPFMLNIIKKYYPNYIIIKKNESSVEKIKEKINNRKINDDLICIFADAMKEIPIGKNIAPFKTGAFVNGFDILPIVIKYKNFDIEPIYYKHENKFESILKQFLNNRGNIIIDVMDIVEKNNFSIEEYKNKIYDKMNKRYEFL